MTRSEALRMRLTPDFTVRGRMPAKDEYDLSLRILRDFYNRQGYKWRERNLSDVEHDVLMSLYRAGILEQNRHTLEHRLTKYGEVYYLQRADDRSAARDHTRRRRSHLRGR